VSTIRRLLATVFAATSIAALTLTSPAGAATPSIWTVQTTPDPHASQLTDSSFASVSASGPGDAWGVGTFSDQKALDHPLVEHWNGTTWVDVTVPQPKGRQAVFSAVDDLSPDNAWAVGEGRAGGTGENLDGRTLIEHFNGTTWSIVPSPNPATGVAGDSDTLTSIAGTGPDDLWAAGSDLNENTQTISLLFEHWNGTTWTAAASPTPLFSSQFALAITAVNPTDVWAVGEDWTGNQKTLSAHWNGTAWSIVATPNLANAPSQNLLTGVSSNGAGEVWASGFAHNVDHKNLDVPYVLHWTGAGWMMTKVPTVGSGGSILNGIAVLSATDVWAVGQTQESKGGLLTLAEQFNGSTWTISDTPNPGKEGNLLENTLQSVSGAGGHNVFAVGTQDIPGQLITRTLAINTTQG
jgi:hypothetical protein